MRILQMHDSQRAHFERRLLADRARLQKVLAGVETPPRDAAGEFGRFGDDAVSSSGGASVDDDRALAAHALRELSDIDRALAQLREDPEHFGICTKCAKRIPYERLRLVPDTHYCAAHAAQ